MTDVDGDRSDPGAKIRRPTVPGQRAVHLDEDLLHAVVDVGGGYVPRDEAADAAQLAAVERGERGPMPVEDQGDEGQIAVVQHHESRLRAT